MCRDRATFAREPRSRRRTLRLSKPRGLLLGFVAGVSDAARLLVGVKHVVLVDHVGRGEERDDENEVADNLAERGTERAT